MPQPPRATRIVASGAIAWLILALAPLWMSFPAESASSPPPASADAASDALAKGEEAYNRQDYVEAMRLYRIAADQGNDDGEFNVGDFYMNGQGGVAKDYAEAMRWFRKAADQGNAAAQNNIGVLYANGHGVTEDHVEAAKWFRMSAEQGDVNAERSLARAYRLGTGVPQDMDQARLWMGKAAEAGDTFAKLWMATHPK
jgi:TPR repeat protein